MAAKSYNESSHSMITYLTNANNIEQPYYLFLIVNNNVFGKLHILQYVMKVGLFYFQQSFQRHVNLLLQLHLQTTCL